MKEISGSDVLDIMFEELDIESCSFIDINEWAREYNKKYPKTYIDVTRNTMLLIRNVLYYWNYKEERFYKQYHLNCPICDDIHYKYPENDKYKKIEKYYKINKLYERSNGKSKTAKQFSRINN